MVIEDRSSSNAARGAPLDDISTLLSSGDQGTLFSLIDHPYFDETHVCILLERKDLPGTLIEEISKRRTWRASYRVRRALAAHPHTPRLIAMRVLRDLHLMDLVHISLLPATPGELRRLAEERILAQLPQLPLGQRIMLARRGPARVAAGLIVQGPQNVMRTALDSSFLTESQLLKTLAKESLTPRVIAAIANHEKWSKLVNVRVALLRHEHARDECVAAFVSDLPRHDIEDLLSLSRLAERVRVYLRQELARRLVP